MITFNSLFLKNILWSKLNLNHMTIECLICYQQLRELFLRKIESEILTHLQLLVCCIINDLQVETLRVPVVLGPVYHSWGWDICVGREGSLEEGC